jgi:hypothetical protein
MPNQTLTPVSVTPGSKGWDVIDSEGLKYWIPPTQKDSTVSNVPVAKEIFESIGKPIELATFVTDKGTRMIFGRPQVKQGGGGKGRGPGDFESGAQRKVRLESQEACQVLGTARQLIADIDNDMSLEAALRMIEYSFPRLLALVRSGRGEYPIQSSGGGDSNARVTGEGTKAAPSPSPEHRSGEPTGASRTGAASHSAEVRPAAQALGPVLPEGTEQSPDEQPVAGAGDGAGATSLPLAAPESLLSEVTLRRLHAAGAKIGLDHSAIRESLGLRSLSDCTEEMALIQIARYERVAKGRTG